MRFSDGLLGITGFGAGLAVYSLIRRREDMDLRGKIVLITGGSRGLGLEMARQFGAEGCRVIICARDRDELSRAAQFWGTLYVTLATLPHMRERGEGRIVNITSIGGKISVPHMLPYSCAEFAAVALSEGLRSELASSGIRVVTIVPGLMRTGSHLNAQFKGRHEQKFTWFSLGAATPLISISSERAARAIVRSTKRGDAEKILSIPADLLARLHGALPEVTAPILSMVNRFILPGLPHSPTELKSGSEAKRHLNSRLLNTVNALGDTAARQLNEVRG
jgi:short-subunit dehydrogenase